MGVKAAVYKRPSLAILPVPMAILIQILTGFFVLVAVLMVLVILMQRPKSEGLGAAFGGGVTENIFGAQTTNVLTKITGWLAAIFFGLTFVLSMLYAHQTNQGGNLRPQLEKVAAAKAAVPTPAPAATAAPGTATNSTPGPGQPALAPVEPMKPSDQAVGVTQPAPAATAVPAPSQQPTP